MGVALVAAGNDFVFAHVDASGTKTTLTLTDADVLTLAQSAETLRDHIVAKHTPSGGGSPPVVTIPIANVELNHTILEGDLTIGLIQPNGRKHLFSLSRNVADQLPGAIAKYLASMGGPTNQPKH